MNNPLVSIIIVTLNAAEALEETIKSIKSQTYKNIELIVIDGSSNDNTLKVIDKNKKYINYWISEPDKGISDAFNKGVLASHGDYINFQGSGDVLTDSNVIEQIMNNVDVSKDILVCGMIKRVDEKGQQIFTTKPTFSKWHLLYKMALPHQGLFTNKIFFNKYGLFNLKCRYAMDYELLLRAYKKFPNVIMKDVVVSAWKEGGIGANRVFEVIKEYNKIRIENKIAPKLLLWLINKAEIIRYKLF